MHTNKLRLSLAAILFAGGGALHALDEANYTLDSSVISATGYAQDIKDAPASITVITGEEIANKPIRDLGDIVQEVPGVTLDVAKTGQNNISIRGLGSDYTLILIDGKRVNMSKGFDGQGFDATTGWLPPASMIERVEVIRGPASIIYGSDAMGGVINIITKKNPDKVTGSVGLESRLQEHSGTWGNIYGVNGNIFAPIDDKISINVRGKYIHGEQNRFYKADVPGFNVAGQSATALANPYTSHSPTGFKNANLGARINYNLDEQNDFYFDADFGFQRLGSLNTSARSVTAIRDYERYNYVLNHDGDYDFGRFNNYIQFNTTSIIPHSNVPIGGDAGTPNHASLTYNEALTLSSVFTKNFDFGDYGSLIFNTGPYFFRERLLKRASNFDNDTYQVAVFAEGEYLINDWVSTTLGTRINNIQDFGTFLSPRAFVNVYPNDWLTVKAGIASGLQVPQLSYRFDGLYDISTTGTYTYGNTNLKPETSFNYEISAIADFSLATITATAYITDFKDAIDTRNFSGGQTLPDGYGICPADPNTTGERCVFPQNVAKAKAQGIEIALNSKALLTDFIPRGIYFDLAYSLTDTEQRSGDEAGRPLNNVPLHNLSTKVSYKGGNWDTYLRYVGKYKTPTYGVHVASIGPGRWYEDLHTVDLGANYRFKNNVTVGAVINNLFDLDTVDYVAYNNGNSLANNYQRMIPGRNLWLTVKADF